MDQREFLRQMEELVDFGRTKENLLTKQEIADYCSDWNLTEEQMPFVYAYLKEHRIEVEGYRAPVEKTEEEAVEKRTVSVKAVRRRGTCAFTRTVAKRRGRSNFFCYRSASAPGHAVGG